MIKFLSSIRLAVSLIVSLTLASVFATIYPQIEVFNSFWFRGLLILFCINLFLCTLKSMPALLKRIRQGPKELKAENATISFEVQDPVKYKSDLKEFLNSKGFKVKEELQDGFTNIFAQGGSLSLLAPHLLHGALIVVLIGGFLSSFGTEGRVSCFVGEKADIPAEIATDMKIQVNEFKTLYDTEGAIENWVTDFSIFIGEEKVTSGNSMVNNPFKYQGVVFYQKSYGYTHLIEIKGEDDEAFRIPDGKIFKLGEQYFNLNYSPEGTVLKLFKGHEVAKTMVVKEEDQIDFSDEISLVFLKTEPYTVLGLKKDPGTKVVMTGFLLMTIASALFWTGRYREVFITIKGKTIYLFVFAKIKGYKEDFIADLKKEVGVD